MTTSPYPNRAVVTGAAGFIGTHLVERLVQHGTEVIGIDNERSGDWSRTTVPCTRVDRDLVECTQDELTELFAGADACFHLAAEKYNSSKSTPQRVIDVNIAATHRVFEAAARAAVPKVVFTSSLYAYGSVGPDPMREDALPEPTTAYGMSKVAGEHLLRVVARDHGLRWTVARLFFIYGPRQYAEGGYKSVITSNFERIARDERPTVYGDGEQSLDYTYIDDCIDALVLMLAPEHDGRTLNVGSGRAVTVNDLIARMLAAAGSTLEPLTCPPDWTKGSRRVADIDLVSRQLHWSASTPIDEGLRRVWTWMNDGDV